MIALFKQNIQRMIDPDDKLLAAVSGGVDSMVMLDLLVKALGAHRVEVAHCNFRLRPVEADKETELVKKTCAELNVKCNVAYFETKEFAAKNKLSTQEAARQLRYAFFDKVLVENDLQKIVVAHNQDDTIETFFINLLRGSGLRGLRGIAATSGNIIRPLMFASRAQIEAYAIENGVVWLVDSSNNSDDYLRNKLRHNVLPVLKECRDGVASVIVKDMERLSVHYDFEQQVIENLRDELFEDDKMSIDKFATCYCKSQFLLFSLLEKYGFSWEVCGDIFRSIEGGDGQGKIFFSQQRKALIDRGFVNIEDVVQSAIQVEYINKDDARVQIIERELVGDFKSSALAAYFDVEKLQFPLVLRRWSDGDKFRPFGMGGASKKVSDLLTDMRVSLFDKERVRVLVSGGDIVWVVGLRTAHSFCVDDTTVRAARITI